MTARVHVRRVIGRRQTLPKVSRGLVGILLMAASLVSAATGVATSAATAADLASIYYGGPAPYFAFSWAEPYVGAALGNEWGSIDDNPTRPNGFAGGPETGFNRQNGSLVHGSAADIGFSAADDTFAPWQFSNPWFGTMRGRAGGCRSAPPASLTANRPEPHPGICQRAMPSWAGPAVSALKQASHNMSRPKPSGLISNSSIAISWKPPRITVSPRTWCGLGSIIIFRNHDSAQQ
jgi:hypothetical protein